MEEERRKRKQRLEEWRSLSQEERKRRTQENIKRRRDGYLKLNPELVMADAQVEATVNTLLAGLMFTASVLFFSFGRELPYVEIFVLLTITDTLIFLWATVIVSFQTRHLRRGEMYEAYHYDRIADTFGWIGVVAMLVSMITMATYVRWELGPLLLVILALLAIYFFHRLRKDLIYAGAEA